MMINIKSPASPHSFAANTYILNSVDESCIIDPTIPYSADLITGKLKYIILTHAHFDHMLEIDEWAKNTDAKVLISEDDALGLSDPTLNCYMQFAGLNKGYAGEFATICDGDELPLGNDCLRVVSLPGHTPGCIALLFNGSAIVGDTVFAGGGFGRCDLPGGNFRLLRESILKIINWPEGTLLYCGHGKKTTVKDYKSNIRFY